MTDPPEDVLQRLTEYCSRTQLAATEMRGYGLDGFIWQTDADSILKVFRQNRRRKFLRELAVYQRLETRPTRRLQGFFVPALLHYDEELLVLELSYVRPPFILDFAEATLDETRITDAELRDLEIRLRSLYGPRASDVLRLLEALRHMGIGYSDVHLGNIRLTAQGSS